MNRVFLLIPMILMMLLSKSYAQESWNLENIHYSTTDFLGHYYWIDQQGALLKTNMEGDTIAEKKSSILGKLSSIDVKNPFKISLYYPDSKRVQVIDNDLNVLRDISLNKYFDWDIIAVQSLKEGHLILLDTYHSQWIKMDEYGNGKVHGMDFAQLHLNWEEFQEFIIDQTYWVLIFDQEVVVFDSNGVYKNRFPIPEHRLLTYYNEFIYYYHEGQLFEQSIIDFSIKSIGLSIEYDVEGWTVERNKLILHFPKYIMFQNLGDKTH